MSERYSLRKELPAPTPETLLPVEQEYAFYFLQILNGGGKQPPEYYKTKLEACKQKIEALGQGLGKSDEEILKWFKKIEDWSLKKVVGEQDQAPLALGEAVPINGFIVTPRDQHGPNKGSGAGMERVEITSRIARVEALLDRLGVSFKKFSESVDELGGRMRETPYQEFVLLNRKKIILVCDQSGNKTFVIHGVHFDEDPAAAPITAVSKDSLKVREVMDVDAIPDFKSDPLAWEKMLEVCILHEGSEAVQWQSARDVHLNLGVEYTRVDELFENVAKKHPEFARLIVKIVGKYGTNERITTKITLEAYRLVKLFVEEQGKVPKGFYDVPGICALIYKELGGVDSLGISLAEAEGALHWAVFNELRNSRRKNGEKVQRVTGGKGQRVVVKEEEGKVAVAALVKRKKEDFTRLLRPENFLADGLYDVAKKIRDDNNLPADETTKLVDSIEATINGPLAGHLKPYDSTTGEGNFGVFRSTVLARPVPMVTLEFSSTIADHFKERITKNKKLPTWEEGDKNVGDVVNSFIKKHKECPFGSTEFYAIIFRAFNLRDSDFKSGNLKTIQSMVIKRCVKNSFDIRPLIVLNEAAQKEGLRLIEEKYAAEALVPVAEEGDTPFGVLSSSILTQLEARSIVRSKTSIGNKIKEVCASLPAEQTIDCGEKRVVKDKFEHGLFYSKKIAEKIEELVIKFFVNE